MLGEINRDSAFIAWWVQFRTSYWYVGSFAIFIGFWIFINKFTGFGWDNVDLTYLNLMISVLTELQAIVLLIYAARITDRNFSKDAVEKKYNKDMHRKLDKIMAKLEVEGLDK